MSTMTRFSRSRRSLAGAITVLALAIAGASGEPVLAQDRGATAPGRTVEELLTLARRSNPELAAAALDTEAALARVDVAGALPDPVFRTEFEEIERRRGSLAPSRLGTITYTIAQEFPLWGKRDLRREAARAEADSAEARRRGAEREIEARLKAVFAQYYAAFETTRLSEEQLRTVAAIVEVAQRRYGQGRGSQQDAIRAEIAHGELKTSLAQLEATRRRLAAQINALLGRASDTPLARPASLRPVPPADRLSLGDLRDRAKQRNPAVASEQAQISAAERERRLVDKSWYPDVTIGVSAVDEDRRFFGYEAMIEIRLPLRWGLRDAQARDATARLGAARSRLDAAQVRIDAELEEAFWSLDAARRIERILHETHVPQTELSRRTALAAYELDRGDLITVLEAERQVRRVAVERVNARVEQQIRLAEIERLIGDDL